MNITNLDFLIFGVDDVAACNQFLTDYGLRVITSTPTLGRFEALDGTGLIIRRRDDPALPPPLPTGTMLRETVYGVADRAVLDEIRVDMERDRAVRIDPEGSVSFCDDAGFALRFEVSVRRAIAQPGEAINVSGGASGRAVNEIGISPGADLTPRTLSHVVCFVSDVQKLESFYVQRLGFRCVDRFSDVGPFLRPAGNQEHHVLFLLKTPPHMLGIEHFAFHMAGPTGLMQAGYGMTEKGYQSFWGPGRHIFGSNWFWYFNSPMGCHAEYDADMDLHDDSWQPRDLAFAPERAQSYLFQYRQRWSPMGPPRKNEELEKLGSSI